MKEGQPTRSEIKFEIDADNKRCLRGNNGALLFAHSLRDGKDEELVQFIHDELAELEQVRRERDDAREDAMTAIDRAEAAEQSRERMREALGAARDVLAALQKQLSVVPGQVGYSATMTDGEIQAGKAIQALAEIIRGA